MKTQQNKITILLLILAGFVSSIASAQQKPMQYWRPYDQDGVNVFETSKTDTVGFDQFHVRVGGNFAQQFQMIRQTNEATPKTADNTLTPIGVGFNLATANLNIDAQLADGVRLNLVTYLSSRHHSEAWVKGGYIQIDKVPFLNSQFLDNMMEYVTLKIGHMEINYGDQHFRRTDNGNALYNPFVGNLILDAFTTEIGGEAYFQNKGFLAMLGVTGGEIKGDILNSQNRRPSFYGKLGYDKQFTDAFRFRLTGSVYTTKSSNHNTLFSGDRTGSRYYLVMTNSTDVAATRTSGRWDPKFFDKVTAYAINPFVKVNGLELFGDIEIAKGNASFMPTERTINQYDVDAVYRFLKDEKMFVGVRYNMINGELEVPNVDSSINRIEIGGGWFLTKNLLLKAEYVNQKYNDFADASIYHKGEFHGGMIEAVVGF